MFFNIHICLIGLIVLMSISIMLSVIWMYYIYYNMSIIVEWEILSISSNKIVMIMLFDWMSLSFMSFVLMISSLVIFYSSEYMHGDKSIDRFIILVLMFVLSMMLLIISPNLISILLGWDGLGLVSYLLVIYYQNVKSYNAGMLTALSNRIGDVALLMAIAWMLNYGSWNYIYYLNDFFNKTIEMKIIGSLIILAAMTKSAQIPFSAWLPAAMAAPTPVSALVHSSTLVTAGVYLLIRFNDLIMACGISNFMLLMGCLTMFMAGVGANFEFDLKKIIALSTLSQLGLMMSILSMGMPDLAFFHLLTHALFKALLFMCAGVVIHKMMNSQDIRYMGGLIKHMPLTAVCFHVSNLALCGMPFLAGFYSKDLILEMVCMSNGNVFSFLLYFLSTGLTVCYTLRLIYYSMIGDYNSWSFHPLSDEDWVMSKSMIVLVLMAVIGGSVISWMILSCPLIICLPWYFKLLTLNVSLVGGYMGYEISKLSIGFNLYSLKFNQLSSYMGSMWFMPYLSTSWGLIFYPLYIGRSMFECIDQGWSEEFGCEGLKSTLSYDAHIIQFWQNNDLKIYLISFVIWFILLMFLIIL
uniref:NADH-ubiquinone oxidoreductase chain 5 n=2 Tax=Comicus campestris TaxID=62773 RepID=A0A0N7AS13_9ORTH|nr:NADH dehydrogenase subunit 5 [Comicus campestris]AJW76388.1 NADH dehydrogenase subunit 5 [Comicus campestris]